MKDLSYLGKVDSSTLRYAERLELGKYWFERNDLELRPMVYGVSQESITKENVNVESELVLS